MNAPSSLAGRAVHVLRRRFPALFGAAVWPYLALVSIFVIISSVYRHAHTTLMLSPHLSREDSSALSTISSSLSSFDH
jgi:hypothetical protein